jgi:5-methylthioadenosine/S-adenosylhomocysteine deaminase
LPRSSAFLLITGGLVLRGNPPVLDRADVLIDGDRIAAVGGAVPRPEGADKLDATDALVLPGLINSHTHAHNNLLRGLAARWTLEDLLNHGPALNANRTAEDQYLSAALGAIEMAKTGCTTAYDLVMATPLPTLDHMEAVARAYEEVGLRAVIAPAVADIPFHVTVPGLMDRLPKALARQVSAIATTPSAALLQLTEQTIRKLHDSAGGRIRAAVAPTIPTQCTESFLGGCAQLVREHGVGLHTHLMESKVQAIVAQRRWGCSAVAHLAKLSMLGPGFVGAHAVWLADDDIAHLADTGAAIAHNPASNLKLGSGIAPVREMLDRGVTVGLGSDGSMSSDNQNLYEAMRLGGLVGNVRFPHDTARWLTTSEVWHMATRGSASALGLGDSIGAIEPGRKADLVLLRAGGTFVHPRNDVVASLVYAETAADVDTVLVDGRVIVRGGTVLTVNEERIRAQAQSAADRVRAANATAWQVAGEIAPYLSEACRVTVASPYPINRYAAPVA